MKTILALLLLTTSATAQTSGGSATLPPRVDRTYHEEMAWPQTIPDRDHQVIGKLRTTIKEQQRKIDELRAATPPRAILVFRASIGFACLPPSGADLRHAVELPYSGPWLMPIGEAKKQVATAPSRGLSREAYSIVREDDPHFSVILERCPPIF